MSLNEEVGLFILTKYSSQINIYNLWHDVSMTI
jgi:hypothetical protein